MRSVIEQQPYSRGTPPRGEPVRAQSARRVKPSPFVPWRDASAPPVTVLTNLPVGPLPIGPPGADGAEGLTGPMGPSGPVGLQGATGPQGPQGNPGPRGPAGPMGSQGVDGDIGPMGLPGPIGPTGPPGATGPQGKTGAAGPKGDTGAAGPPGPAGIDYSTAEQYTGKRWITGQKVYQKTVDCSPLKGGSTGGAAVTTSTPHGIANLDTVIGGQCVIKSIPAYGPTLAVLPYCDPTPDNAMGWYVSLANVNVGAGKNQPDYINCYTTLLYTCTDR